MRASWLLAVPLAACGPVPQPPPEPKPTTHSVSPLLGVWRGEAPVRFEGGGVRTLTSDSRTEYRPDGSFLFSGKMTVTGGRLPANGLDFRLQAIGRWTLVNRVLTERYVRADVTPERGDSPNLGLIAKAMADEVAQQPPSQSDLVTLDRERLVLRDRETAELVRYRRERP